MAKNKVYGQEVYLEFYDGTNYTRIAEIDEFSFRSEDIVKENSSLGETQLGSIDVLDNGGSLSFGAKKSDGALITYFIAQQSHHRGGNQVARRGKTPYTILKMTTTYTDGSRDVLTFNGVVLHSFEGSVAGRTEEFMEKFEGRYKKLEKSWFAGETGDEAVTSSQKGLTLIENIITNVENLAGNIPEFQEYSSADFIQKGNNSVG